MQVLSKKLDPSRGLLYGLLESYSTFLLCGL